jgi:transitional endoplasmic reticulum ATPase
VQGQKISGVNIYNPLKIEKKTNKLIFAIKNYKESGSLGSFGTMQVGGYGLGKTLNVRHIAEQSGAFLFELPMIDKPDTIIDVVTAAKKSIDDTKAPSMILLDEVDYLGSRSEGSTNQAYRAILASLLRETNPYPPVNGLFWFYNSNEPDNIDNALRRPPRTTFQIDFFPPNKLERRYIIDAIIRGIDVKVEWGTEARDSAASITHGFAGADLLGFIQAATLNASIRGSTKIGEPDIAWAKEEIKPCAVRNMPTIEPDFGMDSLAGDYIAPHKEMLAGMGMRIDKGGYALIYGPSGWGKTRLAQSLVKQFGVNGLYFTPADIMDKYVGEPGKRISRIFTAAKSAAPVIVILDEADGVMNPNNPYGADWISVIKANTSERIPGVLFIMIANDPTGWDPAILGRMRKLYVGRGEGRDLALIIKSRLPKGSEVDIDRVMVEAKREDGKKISPKAIDMAISAIEDEGKKVTTGLLINTIKSIRMQEDDKPWNTVMEAVGNDVPVHSTIRNHSE